MKEESKGQAKVELVIDELKSSIRESNHSIRNHLTVLLAVPERLSKKSDVDCCEHDLDLLKSHAEKILDEVNKLSKLISSDGV